MSSGTPQKVMKDKKSLTGTKQIEVEQRIDVPILMSFRLKISIRGSYKYNCKGIDVDIPLSIMTVVTGVSGSGKKLISK